MTPLEIRTLDQYIVRHCVPIISTQTADGLATIHGSGVFYEYSEGWVWFGLGRSRRPAGLSVTVPAWK